MRDWQSRKKKSRQRNAQASLSAPFTYYNGFWEKGNRVLGIFVAWYPRPRASPKGRYTPVPVLHLKKVKFIKI